MNLVKIIEVVNMLIKKTENKQALWKSTSNSSTFSLRFNNGSLVIGSSEILDDSNNPIDLECSIYIYNSEGDPVFSESMSLVSLPDNDKNRIELANRIQILYQLANNSVYKISDTINSLLDELSSPEIVGMESSSDDISDIPF